MIKSVHVLAATALVFLCSAGFAQNETSAASYSSKAAFTYGTAPDGSSGGSANSKGTFKHSFAITEDQESALSLDNSLAISTPGQNFSVNFSNDPKWSVGAKSVKIDVQQSMSGFMRNIKIVAKWGKGKFTVSLKESTVIGGLPSAKHVREPGHPASTSEVVTALTGPDGPVVARAYLAFESNQTERQTIKADGTTIMQLNSSMKSKALVDAPLPE